MADGRLRQKLTNREFFYAPGVFDMMSTLLVTSDDGLVDPGTGTIFDPASSANWERAIATGAIGIASFVTALYYLDRPVHVLHLNHDSSLPGNPFCVVPQEIRDPLLPAASFATIDKQPEMEPDGFGTYVADTDAARLLKHAPSGGRVIVHVDLDYFINDYNGNIGSSPALTLDRSRSLALERMESFMNGLANSNLTVDRWVVATSPGFCCVRHWDWLLRELSRQVSSL